MGQLIVALRLDDIFHGLPFAGLTALFGAAILASASLRWPISAQAGRLLPGPPRPPGLRRRGGRLLGALGARPHRPPGRRRRGHLGAGRPATALSTGADGPARLRAPARPVRPGQLRDRVPGRLLREDADRGATAMVVEEFRLRDQLRSRPGQPPAPGRRLASASRASTPTSRPRPRSARRPPAGGRRWRSPPRGGRTGSSPARAIPLAGGTCGGPRSTGPARRRRRAPPRRCWSAAGSGRWCSTPPTASRPCRSPRGSRCWAGRSASASCWRARPAPRLPDPLRGLEQPGGAAGDPSRRQGPRRRSRWPTSRAASSSPTAGGAGLRAARPGGQGLPLPRHGPPGRPTWPGRWWRSTSPFDFGGWTFYQVNYDPNDPSYSGLEAVRDPGVLWVFVGFVLICVGRGLPALRRAAPARRRHRAPGAAAVPRPAGRLKGEPCSSTSSSSTPSSP